MKVNRDILYLIITVDDIASYVSERMAKEDLLK